MRAESALLAAAIANPRVMNPGSPTARLRRRQQMVMRRMGAVEPPPVLATAPADAARAPEPAEPDIDPVPALAAPQGSPSVLPGQPVPPPKKPVSRGERTDLTGSASDPFCSP